MDTKWYNKLLTEKGIAILCLAAIGICAIFKVADPIAIVTGVVGAIGGFTASEILR